jgi:hypothetical protein
LSSAISTPKNIFRGAALVLVVAGSIFAVGPAFAGVGQGVSAITTVDTEPPWVTVDQFPDNTVYLSGDQVNFHWQTGDSHPSQVPEYFTAMVWVAGQVDSTIIYYPDTSDFTWEWIVPDLYSNQTHVEVQVRDAFGNLTTGFSNDITIYPSTSDVPGAPSGFGLDAPAPNPFNPSTRLSFHLPEPGRVTLTVYDTRGHRIRTLLTGQRQDGDFSTHWDGRDNTGRAQSGGMYVFVLDFQGSTQSGRFSRKAVLIP